MLSTCAFLVLLLVIIVFCVCIFLLNGQVSIILYILFDEGGGHRWRVTDSTDDDHDDIDIGQKSTSWSTAVNKYKYVLCCV